MAPLMKWVPKSDKKPAAKGKASGTKAAGPKKPPCTITSGEDLFDLAKGCRMKVGKNEMEKAEQAPVVEEDPAVMKARMEMMLGHLKAHNGGMSDGEKSRWLEDFGVNEEGAVTHSRKYTSACVGFRGALGLDGEVLDKEKLSVACEHVTGVRWVEEGAKICVKNLHRDSTPEELEDMFKEFGRIVKAETPRWISGIGYVAFETAEAASKAIEAMNGKLIEGKCRKPLHCIVCEDSCVRPISLRQYEKELEIRAKAEGRKAFSDKLDTLAEGIEEGETIVHLLKRHKRIYVVHLPPAMDEEEFKELFEPFGEIIKIYFHEGKEGKSPSYGLVTYKTIEACTEAIKAMNDRVIEGIKLHVTAHKPAKDRIGSDGKPKGTGKGSSKGKGKGKGLGKQFAGVPSHQLQAQLNGWYNLQIQAQMMVQMQGLWSDKLVTEVVTEAAATANVPEAGAVLDHGKTVDESKVFEGKIQRLSHRNGYGFVKVPELAEQFTRDVHIDLGLIPEQCQSVDAAVKIMVKLNDKGQPKAVKCEPGSMVE